MASLFNQTNINTGRYFFATQADGEQQLFTSNSGSAPAQLTYLGITGSGGNQVLISQMPTFEGSDWVSGGDAVFAGANSSYLTLSTIAANSAGVSMSTDRIPGSGVACIESYGTNGTYGGFEFLSRVTDGLIVSSINTNMNNYLSTIGRPGVTTAIGKNGAVLTGESFVAPYFTSLNAQAGGGGRPAYGIQDLSGAQGTTPQARWAIGTVGIATGANAGSDFSLFSYNDAGAFLTSPLSIRRSDAATQIVNISSIFNSAPSGTAQVFPATKDNTEFGQGTVTIAGSSNQATPFVMLFSTPVSGLNPNTQSLLNINWLNSLSTNSAPVNFKVGFSTATAFTNIVQTSLVPGSDGTWTPSDLPGATTPLGYTNLCAMLDSDGLNPNGTGFLYVQGQLSDPNGAATQIYIKKNTFSESTRNSLVYRPV